MRKYKRVKWIFNRNRQQNSRKNEKSTWKAIIRDRSEYRMNREIQQKLQP